MFSYAYKKRTEDLLKEKKKYDEVEGEFTSSLFQLGNRIGDGLPAEVAFGKVAESSKGTSSEGFFRLVNENITNFGMNIDRALFDKNRGAVIFYPSHLIVMSMKILIESVKKGLQVAAKSLMSISEYVKNIKKVQDRLNDLLADIISDMKSNMSFLAPMLSGIIVGLSGMITLIIGNLSNMLNNLDSSSSSISGIGNLSSMLSIFNIETMIPTYWIQVIVGIYLVEIVFILTTTLVTINHGKDDLATTSEQGINLKKSIITYFMVALISIFALTLVAGIALAGITS
jgi:urease gamma subunit